MSRKRRATSKHWCDECRGGMVPGPPIERFGRMYPTFTKCKNDRPIQASAPEATTTIKLDAQQRRAGEREEPEPTLEDIRKAHDTRRSLPPNPTPPGPPPEVKP